MDKSVELTRHLEEKRLRKFSFVAGKLFQGAATCSDKKRRSREEVDPNKKVQRFYAHIAQDGINIHFLLTFLPTYLSNYRVMNKFNKNNFEA